MKHDLTPIRPDPDGQRPEGGVLVLLAGILLGAVFTAAWAVPYIKVFVCPACS